jgi:hypothetical protein
VAIAIPTKTTAVSTARTHDVPIPRI